MRQVRSAAGDWGEVRIPRSVKALVLLNIQSYAGGRDLWGLADTGADVRKGWRTPIFNDGLIEARLRLRQIEPAGVKGALFGCTTRAQGLAHAHLQRRAHRGAPALALD